MLEPCVRVIHDDADTNDHSDDDTDERKSGYPGFPDALLALRLCVLKMETLTSPGSLGTKLDMPRRISILEKVSHNTKEVLARNRLTNAIIQRHVKCNEYQYWLPS